MEAIAVKNGVAQSKTSIETADENERD